MEATAEVVHRSLSLGLLPDDAVHFKPNELAFGVVVEAAAPVLPLRAEHSERLHGNSRVFERPPGAASAMIERGRSKGQRVAILFGSPQARPRGEYVAQIFRESFVDPEQVPDHRVLIMLRRESRGPA